MAEITASMVKDLREKTDAPMMECKKALTEANGDMAKAEEILRVKLGNKAAKASSRVAAEGVVATWVAADGKLASLVEVNCETDFVAKNPEFLAMAAAAAELVAQHDPADVPALAALSTDGRSLEAVRTELVGRIGENMSLRRFVRIKAQGRVAHYVHGGAKIGVLVDVVGGDETLGKDIAMHIAASRDLVALTRDQVPEELIRKERDIAAAKAAESGKPAEIVQKMVEGAVQKFLKEVTLLSQPFVKDDKVTVEQLLKARGASVPAFVLYRVGEGIEKKTADFAAEVAAAAAGAR
ncbi:MAG: translation elongation factor Ts [Betaproteobacteria bacterium]|jgi:elongation factor Ts|nr:elongation factor Ts [Rhodocyclaceae bacterium]MCA3141209.1 elongation factor Ts [Rhodocyclaceae bacterium]MCE2896485.1 translation elongation factor Ts [Betaproteobacteria bacterium]